MEIKAPTFPESITEGTVAEWHKKPGEQVNRDDLLADIETDKVVIEVVAPDDGVLTAVLKAEGEIVESEEVIAHFEAGGSGSGSSPQAETATSTSEDARVDEGVEESLPSEEIGASPAARKLAAEASFDIDRVVGSGRDGRITKEDVAKAIAQQEQWPQPEAAPAAPSTAGVDASILALEAQGERVERRVPMTRLRATIARRMVEAQHNAAMLTTFNEVDMSPVMALRKKYQDQFQATHNGTRLGFMSFFVRASVEA